MKPSRENEIPGPSSVNGRTGDSNNNPWEVGKMSGPFASTSSSSTGSSTIDGHREVEAMPEPSSPSTSVSINAAGAGGAGAEPRATPIEAFAYIKLVKDIFIDDEDKYRGFLKIMKHFKDGSMNPLEVATRVKELFKGYPELLLGFNGFLPRGYEIILSDEEHSCLASQLAEFTIYDVAANN